MAVLFLISFYHIKKKSIEWGICNCLRKWVSGNILNIENILYLQCFRCSNFIVSSDLSEDSDIFKALFVESVE